VCVVVKGRGVGTFENLKGKGGCKRQTSKPHAHTQHKTRTYTTFHCNNRKTKTDISSYLLIEVSIPLHTITTGVLPSP
jgi:hypothetical protein